MGDVDFGRIALGVGTGGLSEGANFLTGGGLYGSNKKAQQFSNGPRPELGNFNTLRDQSGLLGNPNLRLQAGQDLHADKRGLEAFRERALGTGPSAWAQMAQQKQGLEESNLRNRAAAQSASGQAQARSQLASRGGFSGGAAERLAGQGSRDLMLQRQQVGNQGAQARANIGLEDEKTKNQFLSQLPGQEIAALQPEFQNRQMNVDTSKYNIDSALKDKYQEDQWKKDKYSEDMKAWAATEQANAMMRAGGGKQQGALGSGGKSGGGGKK